MKRLEAIKKYFGSNGYPAVTLAELKDLTKTKRDELAEGAARELGEALESVTV